MPETSKIDPRAWSEALVGYMAEYSGDVVTLSTAEGELHYVSPSVRRLLGFAPAELIGQSGWSLIHPDDARALQATMPEAGPDGTAILKYRARRRDGAYLWLETRTRAVVVPWAREVLHHLSESRDISEQVAAEEALRDRERQLSNLIANMPGMVIRCQNDPQWTMTFVSEGCVALTGYQPEDFVDNRRLSFRDLYHPDDHAYIWDEVQAALMARRPFEVTYRLTDRHGGQKWVWSKGRGVYGDDGDLLFLEGLLMDITAQRALSDRLGRREAQLTAANLELTRLGRLKDEFLSTVSHELRTPLSAIHSAAVILGKEKAGPLNAPQQGFMSIIRDQAATLHHLVDDMLAFQALEAGDTTLALAPSDMRELVQSVLQSEAAAFAERRIQLACELPPGAMPCVIDWLHMAQVLHNLLSNAAKFTPAGGRVVVRAESVGAEVRLSVQDNGIGIPPEALEGIFEKFVQLDGSLTRSIGGTGLGLALCREIVEGGHGGRIWAESVLGEGSTVHVALPAGA